MSITEAVLGMEKRNAHIYTQEEIDALNFYMSKYHLLRSEDRMHSKARIQLRRSSIYWEEAEVLWIQPLEDMYYILRCQFDDGGISDWLASIVGTTIRPLINLSTFKVQQVPNNGN